MDFKDCMRRRLAKDIREDEPLAASLLKTSKNKADSMERLELNEVTASSKISLAYDSLRELLEALAVRSGYKIYNHECYVYFLKEVLKESSIAEEFDELRRVRNNINYYAKDISIGEAKVVLKRIKLLRDRTLKLLGRIKFKRIL